MRPIYKTPQSHLGVPKSLTVGNPSYMAEDSPEHSY